MNQRIRLQIEIVVPDYFRDIDPDELANRLAIYFNRQLRSDESAALEKLIGKRDFEILTNLNKV